MAQGQPGMKWHIDSWDALGGRAFASQREHNKELADCGDSISPTIYIGPPAFQPEQIANISIAISASHSNKFVSRVPRLANDEGPDELSFPTASAVAEFVRRAFIGGGRTRGGGAPVVEGGGPEGPPEGERGARGLAYFLQDWEQAARRLDLGESGDLVHDLSPAMQHYFGPRHTQLLASVENGALQLIGSVFLAFPYSINEVSIERWHAAATTLESAISELGIWRAWSFAGVQGPANRYLSAQLDKLTHGLFHKPSEATRVARCLLRAPFVPTHRIADISDYVKRILYGDYFLDVHDLQPGVEASASVDRFEALFNWPLVHYVRAPDNVRNAGQLLAAFVSAPAQFSQAEPAILDVICFAAAFLGSRSEDRQAGGWRERAAANWLGRSMPKYIFRAHVEEFIWNPQLAQGSKPEGLADEKDLPEVHEWQLDGRGADR